MKKTTLLLVLALLASSAAGQNPTRYSIFDMVKPSGAGTAASLGAMFYTSSTANGGRIGQLLAGVEGAPLIIGAAGLPSFTATAFSLGGALGDPNTIRLDTSLGYPFFEIKSSVGGTTIEGTAGESAGLGVAVLTVNGEVGLVRLWGATTYAGIVGELDDSSATFSLTTSNGFRLHALPIYMENAASSQVFGIDASTGEVNVGIWGATAIDPPFGGTGRTSHTAYAPIFGGTTSTGPQQSKPCASGEIWISAGSGALPNCGAVPTGVGVGTSAGLLRDSFVGDGSTTVFALSGSSAGFVSVTNNQLLADVADYTESSSDVTFAVAPPNGARLQVAYFGSMPSIASAALIECFSASGSGTTYALANVPLVLQAVTYNGLFQPTTTWSTLPPQTIESSTTLIAGTTVCASYLY